MKREGFTAYTERPLLLSEAAFADVSGAGGPRAETGHGPRPTFVTIDDIAGKVGRGPYYSML